MTPTIAEFRTTLGADNMHYVMFSKHDHKTLETQPAAIPVFACSTAGKARLLSQTMAYELRDFWDDGIISFIENGQQGHMWIVFVGSKSYGTFFVESPEEIGYEGVTLDPSWKAVQEVVALL